MRNRLAIFPLIFLGSGVVLTVAGLAIMVARGAEAPVAALALLAVGLLDGVTGVVWTVIKLFSRRDEEAQRTLVLASGLLAVIFLGAVLAALLYLHVIAGCMRSWGIV
jgi:hypothetical protein